MGSAVIKDLNLHRMTVTASMSLAVSPLRGIVTTLENKWVLIGRGLLSNLLPRTPNESGRKTEPLS